MAGVALSRGRLTSGECFFSGYAPSASVTIHVDRRASRGAAIVRVSSGGSAVGAIFVVDASVFFNVICEETACTDATLKAGVRIISGRLMTGTTQVTRALRTTHPASDAGQLVIPD